MSKKKLRRASLQRHVGKLSEIGLQTYGRRAPNLKLTSDTEALRLCETYIRNWQKEMYELLDCTPFERCDD